MRMIFISANKDASFNRCSDIMILIKSVPSVLVPFLHPPELLYPSCSAEKKDRNSVPISEL